MGLKAELIDGETADEDVFSVLGECLADLVPNIERALLEHRYEVFARHLTATVRHRPRPYPGPVLVIAAPQRPDLNQVVADWTTAVQEELTIRTVVADHYSLLRGTHAETVAGLLRDWMQRTRAL